MALESEITNGDRLSHIDEENEHQQHITSEADSI